MIYRFHDFVADVNAGCLTRAGVEVHLRRKSFQVLALLLERHSQLVTKQAIFAAVWPELALSDDVLVGVIGELRKALGDNAENPVYIRTSRRAGYRFVAPLQTVDLAPPARLPAASAETPAPPPLSRTRPVGAWLAAGLLLGAAGGWLLASGFVPHIPRKTAAGEVGWWRFDETSGGQLRDVSGNGNDGELHGGAARLPGGLDLDGIRAWAGGAARNLPLPGEPLTFTAWVQAGATRADFTNIFQYGSAHDGPSGPFSSTFLALLRPDGRWEAEATGSGAPLIGGRIADGRWRHLALSYDGLPAGAASLYTDGAGQARAPWFHPPRQRPNEAWSMGQFVLPPATFFHGRLRDVRIYRRALTAYHIAALYRCSSPEASMGSRYFLPLYSKIVDFLDDAAGGDAAIRNSGRDFAGVQFAERRDSCSLASQRGADMGQDVRISADLLTPRDAAGHHTQAGPFFRSRLAAPGDGVMGGASAGYWVALDSNAAITVRRLNPQAVVAYAAIDRFDPAVYHRVEVVAVGERLQVKLDGRLVEFEQEGRATTVVSIPPLWKGPPAAGYNEGGAGIEFAAIDSRGLIGGQEARQVRIEPASSLW